MHEMFFWKSNVDSKYVHLKGEGQLLIRFYGKR